MKTIRSKILVPVLLIVCVSLGLLGGVSIYLNTASTSSTLEQAMTETAAIGAERVAQELACYRTIVTETGSLARLSSATVSLAEKKAILDQKISTYGLSRGDIIRPDGIAMFNGNDYSDRDYFHRAMNGETVVTDPLIAKTTGQLSVIVAAPLWKDGRPGGEVFGVVFFVPPETFLNDIVSSIHVSDNGSAYMVNSTGITIAHKNIELVKAQDNDIENAKVDSTLVPLGKLTEKMAAGESGFGTYDYHGISKFLAYANVEGSDGWCLAVNAPVSDFTAMTTISVIVTIGLMLLALVVAAALVIIIANGIAKPIRLVERAAAGLAQGQLDVLVDVHQNDEVGQMASSFQDATAMMRTCIQDLSRCLSSMAKGDFRVEPEADYRGDFCTMQESVHTILSSLSQTLREITTAAAQVSAGSDQVSAGAQALAQGATEQASAVEELSASINEIAGSAGANSQAALVCKEQSQQAGAQVDVCAGFMKQMVEAMDRISGSSEEIGKIIATIENIAFQTNILALNAAVEAARAGTAGKGFAVVADEVRNLAGKSDQAAKATKELIENSIQAVKHGNSIVSNVSEALEKTVQLAGASIGGMGRIADAVNAEALSIGQVTVGIDQISAVVQTNSATSEESAAASEELSSQAQVLKHLAAQFQLRDQNAFYQ